MLGNQTLHKALAVVHTKERYEPAEVIAIKYKLENQLLAQRRSDLIRSCKRAYASETATVSMRRLQLSIIGPKA